MRQPPPWVTHEEMVHRPIGGETWRKGDGCVLVFRKRSLLFRPFATKLHSCGWDTKLYSSSSQPQLKHERRRDDTYFGLRFKLHFSRSVRLKSRYWFFSLLTTYFCWLYFWVLVKFVCPSVCKHSFERILIKRWGHVNNALKFGSHPLRSSRSTRWFICGKLTKAL